MDKYSGKRLDGRYEIHELIGVGGMALVYRAYDTLDVYKRQAYQSGYHYGQRPRDSFCRAAGDGG